MPVHAHSSRLLLVHQRDGRRTSVKSTELFFDTMQCNFIESPEVVKTFNPSKTCSFMCIATTLWPVHVQHLC